MTSLLLRIFVPNHKNHGEPAVRSAIGALSGKVGICCNLLLFAFKLVIGTLSGSVSVTADAMTLQLPPGRGIDGIAQLLPAGCSGMDLKQMGNTGLRGHILQNKLRHGTSANIAMANK